jgi:16S rRNA (guanine(527)-N(7))-methyltransferase RsmG
VTWKKFESDLDRCGIEVDDQTRHRASIYLDWIHKWNQRINLTAVSSRDELFRFHLLEAFWSADRFREQMDAFVDIGSGAGLPGLAVKIYRPSSRICLTEKNWKKCLFLQSVSREMGLELEVFAGKAEDYGAWELFPTAATRALKPSGRLLELLKQHETDLLLFRGSRPVDFSGWTVVREERYPLSSNRWVSLLRPDAALIRHPDVPRETEN